MERPLRGEGEGVNTYYLKPTTITTKGKSTFCNEGNNCIIYNIVLVGRAAEGGGGGSILQILVVGQFLFFSVSSLMKIDQICPIRVNIIFISTYIHNM